MPPDGPERPSERDIAREEALKAIEIINNFNEKYRCIDAIQEPINGYVSSYRNDLLSKIDEFKTVKIQLNILELMIPIVSKEEDKYIIELLIQAIKNEINTIEIIKEYR